MFIHSTFPLIYRHVCVLVNQSCLTVCDPMDCSPPGSSSVHGILQARILEWVAISFSKGSSWPRNWTRISCLVGRFFTIWATREALYCFCFTFFFFWPQGMWDLSSPTRNWTHTSYIGRWSLNHWTSWAVPEKILIKLLKTCLQTVLQKPQPMTRSCVLI